MVLARHSSPPFAELAAVMLRRSDNEVAESLIREIGWRRAGEGSTEAGLDRVRRAVEGMGVRVAGRDGGRVGAQ